ERQQYFCIDVHYKIATLRRRAPEALSTPRGALTLNPVTRGLRLMSKVPEVRLERTDRNPASPSSPRKRPVFQPADPGRWAILHLCDPNPSGGSPEGATVADLAMWALCGDRPDDPVEGIVEGVRTELLALADLMGGEGASMFELLAKRLGVACRL